MAYFLNKPQRLKLAEDLKKTNFSLGSDVNIYSTTSKIYLIPHNIRSQSSSDLSKELQKSHLSFSDDKKPKISEFSQKFTKKSSKGARAEKASLDIKKHNSVLGTVDSAYYTTSALYHPKPNGKIEKSNKDLERKLRKHNISYGSDKNVMSSTFSESFYRKSVDPPSLIKNEVLDSHISFGQHPKIMKSTSQEVYTPKKQPSKSAVLKESKPKPAENTEKLISTHSLSFTNKSDGFQPLNKERLNDLRASHFNFGSFPPSYSTTGALPQPSVEPYSSKGNISIDILKTHYALGADQIGFVTSYKATNFQVSTPEPGPTIDPLRHLACNSSFGPSQTPQSTCQTTFKTPNPAEIVKTDQSLIKNLKSHHFDLGSQKNSFKTTASELGQTSGNPVKLDNTLLKDLRSSHFSIGNPEKSYFPVQKDYKVPVLTCEDHSHLMKDLRKSHFSMGEYKSNWRTEQKAKFNWVSSVPDVNFFNK